jgi:hypothetical protein
MEAFLNGSEEYQLDVAIELFADNYINFFVGWQQYCDDANVRPIYARYRELVKDEIGLVTQIAEGLGIPASQEKIAAVSTRIREAGGINYFKGVPGRGRQLFNERQIAELRRKAKMLGCRDESFLGFTVDHQQALSESRT